MSTHQATITWLKPKDGGTPILGYTVTATPGGLTCSTDSPDVLSCTITGLTDGVNYTFTVAARNAVGTSVPPTPGDPGTGGSPGTGTGTPGAPPSPVTGVTPTPDPAAPNDGTRVTLHWLAADSELPIIGYRATAEPGGHYCETTGELFCTITGLDPTVDYSFTVVAINGAGSSNPSDPVQLPTDTTPPTVTATFDRPPVAIGGTQWFNGPVTVTWTATDNPGGSGVPAANVPEPVRVTASGTVSSGRVCDAAGNCATASVDVGIDTTAPTVAVSYDRAPVSVDGTQWFDGPVTLTWTATDSPGGSGIPSGNVPAPTQVTQTGTVSSGKVCDAVGNCTTTSVNAGVDATGPDVTITGVTAGSKYTLGNAPTPACTATDAGSGLAGPCTVTVTGGNANHVGAFTATATATDKVGNTTTKTVTYKVIYAWDGFLQPINDTAHQTGQATSVFKAGSTVPAKFTLTDANGQTIQPVTAPVWITPAKGSATGSPVDESVYSDPADSGTTYRLTSGQWQYNWKTDKTQAGYYWHIGVQLDDGETHYVNIALN